MEPEYPSHAPSEIDPDTQPVLASINTSDMDTENSSVTNTPSGHRIVDNGDFLFEPQPINPSDDDKARNADSDLFTSVAAQQQEQEERHQAQQLQVLQEQQRQQQEEELQHLINSNTAAHPDNINYLRQGPSSNPLRQKMTILHPALIADQLPSTKAPTVYALASSVPFPTVNQLSVNLPNQPTASEKVAVPFKTILHPSVIAAVSAPDKVSSGISVGEHSPIASTTPSDIMDTDPIQQPPSQAPFALSAVETNDQQPNENDIHPYFAASNLPIRPRTHLPNDSTPSSRTASPLPGPAMNGWSKMNTGLISPPLSTFFTPPSNSTQAPVHHAMHDEQLDPNLVQQTAKEHQIQSDAAATAAGESGSIGSRTTVFGFAPLVIPGAQQAHMQTSGERVLSDVHCQTMPLVTPSRLSDDRQSLPAADPTGAPHVRAGISPSLNLDQVETRPVEQEKEASVESLVNSKDWSTTGLGPRSSWPVELSVLMPMMMRSASPLAIYWGDQSLLIYNDVSTKDLFFIIWRIIFSLLVLLFGGCGRTKELN
jgi:hypothetical protein